MKYQCSPAWGPQGKDGIGRKDHCFDNTETKLNVLFLCRYNVSVTAKNYVSKVKKMVQVNVAKGLLSIIATSISFFKESFGLEEINFVLFSLAPQKSCSYP